MPHYEFFCLDCQKYFYKILSVVDYEKGEIICPSTPLLARQRKSMFTTLPWVDVHQARVFWCASRTSSTPSRSASTGCKQLRADAQAGGDLAKITTSLLSTRALRQATG